ncbi:sarcolemmal membrane-associated protein-like [Aquarana catesbeiana]|uniref:sarcolemmal membrane-associated protein-like n=1 Tax=Aquarana catesbeiana TaxID=8400 RepID=UPI003CC9E1F3
MASTGKFHIHGEEKSIVSGTQTIWIKKKEENMCSWKQNSSDDIHHVQSGTNDAKQEIQQLWKELSEAQDLAKTSRQKCLELQGEIGRKSSRKQTEDSTKQIQNLQAQLHRLQEETEILREQKENKISSTQEELINAQEEIAILKHVSEQVANERECDICELQGELQEVRLELEHWKKTASDYKKEMITLQAGFQTQCKDWEDQQKSESAWWQTELEELKHSVSSLETECKALQENKVLTEECQKIEGELCSKNEIHVTLEVNGD